MKIDFEELELVLLKFSKYRICDEELKAIKCSETIAKLKDIRETNENKKFITVFIILNNKLVHKEEKRLDNFSLEFFSKYSNNKDKKGFRVIAYCFDTTTKSEKEEYLDFSTTNNRFNFLNEIKKAPLIIKKYIAPIFALIGGLTLLFTYLGFSEYGIPTSYISDTPSIVFLIISSLVILASLSLVIFIFIIAVLSSIYVVISYFSKKINPLQEYNNTKRILRIMKHLVWFVPGTILLIFTILISGSILSSITSNNLFDKKAYELVMTQYFHKHSGYPKILKKDEKYYYLPVKDARYYYVYDIEKVKKLYLEDATVKTRIMGMCRDKNNFDKLFENFKRYYIVNNNYIKPEYLNEHFPIADKNITIENFNTSKLITRKDILKLCSK